MSTIDNDFNKTSANWDGIGIQIGISSTITLVCFTAHELFRRNPRFRNLFTARCHLNNNKSPFPSTKPLGWIISVLKIDETFILENIGLSEVVYLKFLKMILHLLFFCCVTFIPILIPIHLFSKETSPEKDINEYLASNIEEGSNLFWLHSFCSCAASLFCLYLIDVNTVDLITKFRKDFNAKNSIGSVSCRTVMITKLPKEIKSEEDFKEYMQNLEIGKIMSVELLRRPQKLINLIARRNAVFSSLEIAHIKLAKRLLNDISTDTITSNEFAKCNNEQEYEKLKIMLKKRKFNMEKSLPSLFEEDVWNVLKNINSKLLDIYQPTHRTKYKTGDLTVSIDCYVHKLKILDSEISRLQLQGAATKAFAPTNTGFVTFSSAASAQQCAQSILSSDLNKFKVSLAPQVNDIIWPSYVVNQKFYLSRKIIINILTWTLIIFWIFPNILIVSLISYQEISKKFSRVSILIEDRPWLAYLFKNLVPSALLGITQAILPHLLYFISILEPWRHYSALENSVAIRYYSFSFFNTFLVFLVGRAFIEFFLDTLKYEKNIYIEFALLLSRGSSFFINFIIMNISYQSSELLMLGMPLIKSVYSYIFPQSPRKRKSLEATWPFPFYYYMPQHMFIFLLTIVYSTINPLILPIGLVYFCVVFIVFKHQFVYAYVNSYDSGIKSWRLLVRFITEALIVSHMCISCIFVLKSNYYATIPAILMIVFIFYYKYIFSKYNKFLEYMPINSLKTSTENFEDVYSGTFLSRMITKKNRSRILSQGSSPKNRLDSLSSDNLNSGGTYSVLNKEYKHPAFSKRLRKTMLLPSNPYFYTYDLYQEVSLVDSYLCSSNFRNNETRHIAYDSDIGSSASTDYNTKNDTSLYIHRLAR